MPAEWTKATAAAPGRGLYLWAPDPCWAELYELVDRRLARLRVPGLLPPLRPGVYLVVGAGVAIPFVP